MIINVYFCDGIVLHVVQIGCAKIWCQSYLAWACCPDVCGDVLGGGRLVVGQNVRRRFVRYASSDVYCFVYSFAGVFSGVIAFLFYKIVLRSGAIRSYVL